MPGIKRLLLVSLIAFAAGFSILVVFLYFAQPGMVYCPEREILQTPKDAGLRYEEVFITTKDGISISGWYIPAENERGALLFCHGNAGNISHRLDSIRIFHEMNLSVFIFDYRGYGRSGGSPTEPGTYIDAEAAWNFLINEKGKSPDRTILFGRSLGGAVAAELATTKKAAGLILESSFKSIPDMGRKYYPLLPVRLLSRYKYNTIDKISAVTYPKLIIHSKTDEVIPYDHSLSLFEKALPPKYFLEIRGGHNEGFLMSGRTYIDGIRKFLDIALPGGSPGA